MIRIAIVGAAGRQGARFLEAISSMPEGQAPLLIDLQANECRLRQQATRYDCRYFALRDNELDWIDEIDAVIVCVPNQSHFYYALAAALRGKHLLVEKPLATSLNEARELSVVAERAGIVLHTGFLHRHRPECAAAGTLLRDGHIGRLLAIRGEIGHSQFMARENHTAWYCDPAKSGGGVGLDLGIHLVDMACWFLKLQCPEDEFRQPLCAYVVRGARTCTFGNEQIDDILGGAFESALRRVHFSMHASWLEPRKFLSLRLRLDGTEGAIEIDLGTDPATLTIFQFRTKEPRRTLFPFNRSLAFRNEIQRFVNDVSAANRGGNEEGYRAQAMIDSLYRH